MSFEGNKYSRMQEDFYNKIAHLWNQGDKDATVGSFDAHNAWDDYEYLFIDIDNLDQKKCLDFGCGPGRNIVKYANRFRQMDGVDICQGNLDNAKNYTENNGIRCNLFKTNGYSLELVTEQYDVIMSTICMQHICVYEIRYNLLKEFYRLLNNNGQITIQMGFGSPSRMVVDYYCNHYEADGTNRLCDTEVANIEQISTDLTNIGYMDFKYHIRPVGPGDFHPNWIFFNARKQEC